MNEMNHIELRLFLNKAFKSNVHTNLCIWGAIGMGRTVIPELAAKDLGYNFCLIRMATIHSSLQMIRMYQESCKKNPNAKTIIVIDEFTRSKTRILASVVELMFEHSIDGLKLDNVLVLFSELSYFDPSKNNEKKLLRQEERITHIDISVEESHSVDEILAKIGITEENNFVCKCGAKHSSTPNYHQDYCPLYRK